MAQPDYRPTLLTARQVADLVKVDIHAVYVWAKRGHIKRYPGNLFDANAVLLWTLTRDKVQAMRRAKKPGTSGSSVMVIHCAHRDDSVVATA